MRRRLERFIPLVAIAMWVQVFAPVSGVYAVAAAVSDPLAMAAICTGMPSGDAGTVPDGAPDNGHDCCAFCPFGNAATAAVDPPPVVIAHWQPYRRLIWIDVVRRLPTSPAFSHAQARAPPLVVST